jgi:SAM-dependent methyltransferase
VRLIERSLDRLRCPGCCADPLGAHDAELRCPSCDARYPISEGIVDFCPDRAPSQDRAQRAMESRLMVRIYEDYWRPWFTWLASPIAYEDEKDWLLAQREPGPVDCALDVGAGTGRYARLLTDAYRPGLVIALDLSMPMVVRGQRVARQRGYDDILFVRGDAQRLPLRDGVADLLNCFGALHLFPDPARALAELARCARPGTVFSCLTAGRPEGPPTTLREKLFAPRSPLRLFEVDELRAMLTASGFEDFRHLQRGLVLLFTARTPRDG